MNSSLPMLSSRDESLGPVEATDLPTPFRLSPSPPKSPLGPIGERDAFSIRLSSPVSLSARLLSIAASDLRICSYCSGDARGWLISNPANAAGDAIAPTASARIFLGGWASIAPSAVAMVCVTELLRILRILSSASIFS